MAKAHNDAELRARVKGGWRILGLRLNLAERVQDREDAWTRVRQLQGLLPICSSCWKIRDERNSRRQAEASIPQHSGAVLSHGTCPNCFDKNVSPERAKETVEKKSL